MLNYILVAIVFGVIGFAIGKHCKKVDGMLIVNDDSDSVTRWILDVKTDPMEIPKKREVRLSVHTQNTQRSCE